MCGSLCSRMGVILPQFGLFIYPYRSTDIGSYGRFDIGIFVICQSDNRPSNPRDRQIDRTLDPTMNTYYIDFFMF